MYAVSPTGHYQVVVLLNDQYSIIRQKDKKSVKIPLDPQPNKDDIVVLKRYYTTHKSSPDYKRCITWITEISEYIDQSIKNVALVEYVGNVPPLSAHGNSKHCNVPYIKTSQATVEEIDHKLSQSKDKPRQIYYKLLKENCEPRDLK